MVPWPGGERCIWSYNPGTSFPDEQLYSPGIRAGGRWRNTSPESAWRYIIFLFFYLYYLHFNQEWIHMCESTQPELCPWLDGFICWLIMWVLENQPLQSSCSNLCVSVSTVSNSASRNHGYTWHRSYWGEGKPSSQPSSSTSLKWEK